METLQWLFTEITAYFADLFFSLLKYGISFGLIGLLSGLAIVILAGKKGLFRRPNGLWAILAGLNYVYIPLVMVSLGVGLGVVYGTHACADRFIDDTAKPLAKYGQSYFNQAMQIVPEIPWARHQDESLDEILADEMAQRLGAPMGSEAHKYFMVVNQAVVKHALNEAGVPGTLRDPLTVLRELQGRRLPSNAFIGLPRTIHAHCDAFFMLKYGWLLLLFLPLLLLSVIEYVVFRVAARPAVLQTMTPVMPRPAPQKAVAVAMPLRVEKEMPILEVKETPVPIAPEIPAESLTELPSEIPVVPVMAFIPETPPVLVVSAALVPPPLKKTMAAPVVLPPTPLKTNESNVPVPSFQTTQNMKQSSSSTAVTYIVGGALLQLYAGIGSGWLSIFIAIFGFAVFYVGLGKLKTSLDVTGQSAVGMLKTAAIVGAISAFIDLIPLLGIVASLGYIVAFVIELIAYLKLKNSNTIGNIGKSGATLLLLAMILAVVQSLLGLLPFIGGFLAAPVGLAALMLAFFGWIRIQEGMQEVARDFEN